MSSQDWVKDRRARPVGWVKGGGSWVEERGCEGQRGVGCEEGRCAFWELPL